MYCGGKPRIELILLSHIFACLASGEIDRYLRIWWGIFYGEVYTFCTVLRDVLLAFWWAAGGCHHLAVTPFYSGLLPDSLPFWTPKKEAKKVPATSDSAGGPAKGARPLGTPKRRSRSKKAKPCRSAARFLTLFYFSPSGPSGAERGVGDAAPYGWPYVGCRGDH